jgi:hypothetical protein
MRFPARRLRISIGLDDVSLRRLYAAVRPGSGARLEMAFAGGRRMRIAQGLSEADLRALAVSAQGNTGAHFEIVPAAGK